MRLRVRKAVSLQLITVVAVTITLILSFVVGRLALAAEETFTSVASKETYERQQIAITDLQVNGTGDDQLDMNLYADGGSLDFSSSAGLTFNGPTSGADLQFSGTRTAINAALLNLRYVSQTPGEFTIQATLGAGDGEVYNPSNGHVYQVVDVPGEGINWGAARSAAEGMNYGGASGYLATITSQAEQDFILDRLNKDGWIGATDAAVEGEWRWVTGPEAGMLFWSGNGTTGVPVNGVYENWNNSGSNIEPNNGGGTENCAEIRFTDGASGEWNDRDCNAFNMAYVVEYGEDGSSPSVASTQFTVTVDEAPVVAFTSLSPADNSTVLAAQDLSITYNQPTSVSELYFRVYNAVDDSLVEELWDGETEDGLTFVHRLSESLAPGSYYVTINHSGMLGLTDYYHGFDDKTTWNFTVVEAGGIAPEVEDAGPNNGDGNNDGIKDSLQSNVASYVNPTTNKYVVLEADDTCSITSVRSIVESTVNPDGAYAYPAGLIDFVLECGVDGHTAMVKQYYYGVVDSELVVRKYNPTTGAYSTIDTATVTQQTINGSIVAVAAYSVTDGGPLDLDGEENGRIVDPAGLALAEPRAVNAPNTGGKLHSNITGNIALGIMSLLVAGIAVAGVRKLVEKGV